MTSGLLEYYMTIVYPNCPQPNDTVASRLTFEVDSELPSPNRAGQKGTATEDSSTEQPINESLHAVLPVGPKKSRCKSYFG